MMTPNNHITPDTDIVEFDRESLLQEVMRLRNAIRYHRDEKGDARCWLDDIKLYENLPETVPVDATLPPKEEFLGSCTRFWECRQGKSFTTIDECYRSGDYLSLNHPR